MKVRYLICLSFEYPKLVKRLMGLLDKEYSYLGSLSYEVRLDGKFNEFKKEYLDLDNSKS